MASTDALSKEDIFCDIVLMRSQATVLMLSGEQRRMRVNLGAFGLLEKPGGCGLSGRSKSQAGVDWRFCVGLRC